MPSDDSKPRKKKSSKRDRGAAGSPQGRRRKKKTGADLLAKLEASNEVETTRRDKSTQQRLSYVAFVAAAAVAVYSFTRASIADHRRLNCSAMCAFTPTYAGTDRTVPDFELPNMAGEKVRFSKYLGGKPVVLNFWTKTCGPCLDEMPSLAQFAQLAKARGIEVVTITTDENPAAIKDTLAVVLKGSAPPFEILFDPDTTVVADMFGSSLYPETWIIDGKGVIRMRLDGPPTLSGGWSNAIVFEMLDRIGRPSSCPVSFFRGRPTGKHARLCGEST